MDFQALLRNRLYDKVSAELRLIPCSFCNSGVGEPCVRPGGARITAYHKWHAERFRLREKTVYKRDSHGYPEGVVSGPGQAQDSTTEQLIRLITIATAYGLYDAADFIKENLAARRRSGPTHPEPGRSVHPTGEEVGGTAGRRHDPGLRA